MQQHQIIETYRKKGIKPIIFGLAGSKITEEEQELFTSNPCVGYILFARNIETKAQVQQLTSDLKNIHPNNDTLIFIDQEGGRVARIRPPVARKLYPNASYFADIYDNNPMGAKQKLKANYIELMSELKELGIDSACAPVCDIFYPDASDIIGDRSFGNNADKVIDLCKSAISGISHVGGIPVIKHIPGHGRADVDSHYELPIVRTSLKELESTDFKVFQAFFEPKIWAMTAHIIFEAIDALLPITISPKAIEYIRNKIGFEGVLLTDDLGMHALHGEVGAKITLLNKVISLAENNKDWKMSCAKKLDEFFNINASDLGGLEIIETCRKIKHDIKPFFIESLVKASIMSLAAGCNVILHCSGDLAEMQAICKAIEN